MNTTTLVIAIAAAALVGYDILIVLLRGTESSISWTLYTAAKKYPIVPFAFGVLFGHLFWPQI